MKLYEHATVVSIVAGNPDAKPPEKTEVKGWSISSARSNREFLFSVDAANLSAYSGWSFTLTLGKQSLPSPSQFHRLIDNLKRYLKDNGASFGHWLIEWQRRGVPHLHGVYFASAGVRCDQRDFVIAWWLRHPLIRSTGAQIFGQDMKLIFNAVGWLGYLDKHGSRGIQNYQRSPDNIPAAWQGSTGRMWGRFGRWPLHEAREINFEAQSYAQLAAMKRQLMRWMCNYLASQGAPPVYPRQQLLSVMRADLQHRADMRVRRFWQRHRRSSAKDSRYYGLSVWIPAHVVIGMVAYLKASMLKR